MSEIEIEAFRADTPASRGITAAQIADAAAAFDPARHRVPVVMGHPGDDDSAPAFGEISGARADGNRLLVKVKNLAQSAIDGVRESRILNRSVAFWHPNHPSNPAPGKLTLRHLGLLGGAAPAIPNMAPLRFTADDAGGGQIEAPGEPAAPVIFAAPEPAPTVDVAQLATQVAAILQPQPQTNPQPKEGNFSVTEQELQQREQALADREAAAERREQEFAARETREREAANVQFATQLVGSGKFPAGLQADLVQVLNSLPVTAMTFSADADGKAREESPLAAMKRILDAATPVISFSAVTPPGSPQFAAPGADDAEAKALAEANARTQTAWQGSK